MIKALATFVLIGTIDTMDTQFATVEINYNPATSQSPAMAVLPLTAFPCEIVEGDTFYIVKLNPEKDAYIICAPKEDAPPLCGCTLESPCE
jgi:hypothetical protein|tara:strand:- start:237 stop:509 length:273 start_codon:yes stop_codon:yes gene_type:complete